VKILIVDNNSEQLGLLARTVDFLGYTADVARDGSEAIQCHIQHPHDLILLSLELDDYDGFSTAQALRQLERTESGYYPSVICGLAKCCDTNLRERCIKSGMDTCARKPLTSKGALELLVSSLQLSEVYKANGSNKTA
jgi:CheY-like chemotaxis protein